MNPGSGVILCLAYILGLLSTAFPWGGYGVLAGGVVAALSIPRIWRTGPRLNIWLVAGIVGLLASLYFQMRVPQPQPNDISEFVSTSTIATEKQVVMIEGKVTSNPRLTRSGRSQFWLEPREFQAISGSDQPLVVGKEVTGKLYVTVPLLQATGLHPGKAIAVTGVLYKPKPASNPGAFDFQAYLAQQGSFAGLTGRQVSISAAPRKWGWWIVRQRIIRSQLRSLDVPEGLVVSAMVMGRRAVDLPYEIRDDFIQVGLAHVLAASGFHVSLVLGLVLSATRRLSSRIQFNCGLTALVLYVGLTGFQPSVLRAALMGFGALLAMVTQRQVKPLGLLLVAAVVLLLVNPLWIWDLGFQLSFLATLGLVVTVPPITERLDWLPTTIASVISVPLAASIWTLPLLLYTFGLVSPYSIIVNIVASPLIAAIAIGGVISALVAVISTSAGSALAWLLYYPTHALIEMVGFFSQLPGNSVAIGTISVFQTSALYGLIGIVWLLGDRQKETDNQKKKQLVLPVSVAVAIALIVIPVWQTQATLFRVTVLATSRKPVLVIQDRGTVTLINSGDESTARFNILPFLQQQGVNRLDAAIATSRSWTIRSGWFQILERLPIKTFYDAAFADSLSNSVDFQVFASAIQNRRGDYQPLPLDIPVQISSTSVRLINAEPPVVEFQVRDRTWLLLGDLKPADQNLLLETNKLPTTHVLWWPGNSLNVDLLNVLRPDVAIASAGAIDPNTSIALLQTNTQLYSTERDGAIQWTPTNGFETTFDLDAHDANST